MSVSYSKTSRASLYPCTRGVAAIPLFASLHDVCRLAPLMPLAALTSIASRCPHHKLF